MHSVWFKWKRDKDARRKEVESYRNAFEALEEVLRKEFEDAPPPDYDSPSWAYKQADINGQNRMLRRVLSIIDLSEKD